VPAKGVADDVPAFGSGGAPVSADGRLDAPSFHRNWRAVTEALREILAGRTGDVLEVASGTGQHIVEFARAIPGIVWWPSDCDPRLLESIEGWRREANLANLRPAISLDAAAEVWPVGGAGAPPANDLTAIVCLNMLHITAWSASLGLLRGARKHLSRDGTLAIYGAFAVDGDLAPDSNVRFDAALRNANADWGVRDTSDLRATAACVGLDLHRIVPMPSNNCFLEFRRPD
jgi:hypothetical protein